MRNIVLHTARVDNGGRRREAGERVAVGGGKDEIAAKVADDLISRQLAADEPTAPAKKPAAK